MSTMNYVKLFEDGSTIATTNKPSFGVESPTSDWYKDGIWHEPLGYIADGSTNTSTDKAVPIMTSNITPIGKAFCKTENPTYPVYFAFNNNFVDNGVGYSSSGGVTTGDFFGYEFDTPIIINKIEIISQFQNFTIQGSNNFVTAGGVTSENGTWDTLSTMTGATADNSTVNTYSFTNGTPYKSYRIFGTLHSANARCIELNFIEAQPDASNIVPYSPQFTYLNNNEGKLLGVEVANGVPVDLHYTEDAPKIVESVAKFDKVIADNLLGQGQTWQDVTSIRSSGVTYTNDTGKPIEVKVSCSSGDDVSFKVDGVMRDTFKIVSASYYYNNVGAIVPNGSTYLISSAGTAYINVWSELR